MRLTIELPNSTVVLKISSVVFDQQRFYRVISGGGSVARVNVCATSIDEALLKAVIVLMHPTPAIFARVRDDIGNILYR